MSKAHDPARGIYRRGNIYWLAMQRSGKRDFISLETSDFPSAVTRAEEMWAHPGSALETEIDRFLAHKKKQNEFTRFSAGRAASADCGARLATPNFILSASDGIPAGATGENLPGCRANPVSVPAGIARGRGGVLRERSRGR